MAKHKKKFEPKYSDKKNIANPIQPQAKMNTSLETFYKGKKSWWVWLPIIITFIVYLPSLNNDFIPNWDDGGYIVESEPDKAPIQEITLSNLAVIWNPTNFYKGNYHPLTTTFYMLEFNLLKKPAAELNGKETDVYSYKGYYLKKSDSWLFHINNLLFHLANIFLVFWLIWLLTKGNLLISGIVALLFGIHPMHVESVAWISERKDVLYTFLFLSATLCYYYYAYKKGAKKLLYYSLILFTLSLFSKSAAVTLPVILVLFDWYYKREFTLKTILEKVPFFAVSMIFGILAILSQGEANAIQNLDPLFSYLDRIMLASYALSTYIVKLFVPVDLMAMYAYPSKIDGNLPLNYMLAPLAILVIGVLLWFSLKKNKVQVFGFAFFVITISLVLQLLPVGGAVMAERYTYVPYIGLFFIIGYYFNELITIKKSLKTLAYVVLGGWLIFLIATTFVRIEVWKDGGTVFEDILTKNPNMPMAYDNLGYYYFKWDKKNEKSIFYYNECLRIDPKYYNALANRGVLYYNIGKTQEALKDFNEALKLRQDKVDPIIGRANTLSTLERFAEAIPDYNRYMKLKDDDANAYMWRGIAYYRTNKLDSAMIDLNKAIELNPKQEEAYYFRAYTLTNYGKYEEAWKDINITLSMNKTRFDTYNLMGLIRYYQKRYAEAITIFTEGLQVNPNQPQIYVNRSKAYYEMKEYRKAWEDINTAGRMGFALDKAYFIQLQSLIR